MNELVQKLLDKVCKLENSIRVKNAYIIDLEKRLDWIYENDKVV